VQLAFDSAYVGRQFSDDIHGRQPQNLVAGDVRVSPEEGVSGRIDTDLANRKGRPCLDERVTAN